MVGTKKPVQEIRRILATVFPDLTMDSKGPREAASGLDCVPARTSGTKIQKLRSEQIQVNR
ncbi:MAG: hypothetical protein A2X94_08345 [Bdellovibrionales bacterium GWB1_55_8]|nr:MAG: hypothetical protein A2X94_08345 [Bdellovibrionales bacterium GWB1_55_8]